MFNTVQVVFLAVSLSSLHIQARAQGFYSTYSTPYQNSFAFATPNLKQVFTTKLASGPQIQQFSQQLQDQQVYNLPQRNVYANLQQPQTGNLYPEQNGGVYATSPQQFQSDDQLRQQQLAYYQQQQLQQQLQQVQQQQQYLEQFQAPFAASQRDNNIEQQANQQQEVRTQNLLGVSYSPSTQVSQVKFDSGKLKYDF